MRILRWIWARITGFFKYLLADIRNLILFILALPALFALFLVFIFSTKLADPFIYKEQKDKDKEVARIEQGIIYTDQGWEEGYRQKFYYTPQGSHVIPLDMALALENRDSEDLIFTNNGSAITKYGYLSYPQTDKYGPNPYGLPIGFVEDIDRQGRAMLGMNCASCHTANIQVGGKTLRIDGGAALADFMGLLEEVDTALVETLKDEKKLERFMNRQNNRLLEDKSLSKKELLERLKSVEQVREELKIVSVRRQNWQRRNKTEFDHGFGRVDAFGIIFNQVVGRDLHLDSNDRLGNVRTPIAPASYPVLWDTPYMGRVQWTGGSNNRKGADPLARNVGQVLGVFGSVEVTTQNSLPGLCSTPNRQNLELYNFWLESLKSPKWQDAVKSGIFKKPAEERVKRGREIYFGGKEALFKGDMDQGCAECHAFVSDELRNAPRMRKRHRIKAKDKKNMKDGRAIGAETLVDISDLSKGKDVCYVPIHMISQDVVKTDRNLVDTGRRTGAKTGRLAGQESKFKSGTTIGAEEDYMLVLAEMVTGSLVGSFLSASCDGKVSAATLIETASTFGNINRGGAKHKFKKRIGSGFSLASGDIERGRTNLSNASEVWNNVEDRTDLTKENINLAEKNETVAKANLDQAKSNAKLNKNSTFLPSPDLEEFQIDIKKAKSYLNDAETNLAQYDDVNDTTSEDALLARINYMLAKANVKQAEFNEAPLPSDPPPECRDADNYTSFSYKARPLNGIWASSPYLHNGSVPTLYDLLLPTANEDGKCLAADKECRPDTFHVGSTEFDTVHVGYKTDEVEMSSEFDTRLNGNSNAGHTFMIEGLSREDRLDLVEFLKTL